MEELTFEIGCFYCYDSKRKKEKDALYFFDAANNLRECDYCPKCGRKYGEVRINEQLDAKQQHEYGADAI